MKFNTHEEILDAISENRPVVALESTVIAHGLPYPQNLETAQKMESAVRDSGAVPATIALVGGVPTVGLDAGQLRHFAEAKEIRKASIRDLPIIVARKLDGATTVSTTMLIAHRAGISVFATGGIGGVHRGIGNDVSADLPVLASTPMTTVCSGAKIVLDLEATREWLETYGVTVLGWKTAEYPAFYSSRSGLEVDMRVDDVEMAAAVIKSRNDLSQNQAVLLTVPPPADLDIEISILEQALTDALNHATEIKITGKALTPFLLSEMAKTSEGKTLETNIGLLINNASIAGSLANELM